MPLAESDILEQCQSYWNICSQLDLDDDLIVSGCHLVILSIMRRQILQELHSSHQGTLRATMRAQFIAYWPGTNNDIDNVVLSCKQCQDHPTSHPKEPLVQKPKPHRPFQKTAVDFCLHAGHDFLIVVDYYTDWPDIIHMGHTLLLSNSTRHFLECSVIRECQTSCGQMKDPSIHLNFSRTSQGNEDFTIAHPHLCTHRAMRKMSPQSNL